MTHLDYGLNNSQERLELVEKILSETPDPSPQYLEILADYLLFCLTKEEKKQKKIITDNRKITIDKRETSYEGLVDSLESGENSIYNFSNSLEEGNKGAIFRPKVSITKEDIETIPFLSQIKEAIEIWQSILPQATGKDIYTIKKAIIELRRDQYLIKDYYKSPLSISSFIKSNNYPRLDDTTHAFNDKGFPIPEGVSLLNPKVCSAILCNYNELRSAAYGHFDSDLWYLLEDFDSYYNIALDELSEYREIAECKKAGLSNSEILETLHKKFSTNHTSEYVSQIWRKKIPRLIAQVAEYQYIDNYYLNVEKGQYKKCSKCGQIKLMHNINFSRNSTSKDGFYSLCKHCRKKTE